MDDWEVKITVPCTSANLGPGFDVLGLALDLYMVTYAKKVPKSSKGSTVKLKGKGEGTLPEGNDNMIIQVAHKVLQSRNVIPQQDMELYIENDIPIGKGLGSSGVAVVTGVTLANHLFNLKLSPQQVVQYCAAIEGHPDNCAASVLGGLVHNVTDLVHSVAPGDKVSSARVPLNPSVCAVVVAPNFELATSVSRSVLPTSYSLSDLVYNVQRVVNLLMGLVGDLTLPHNRAMVHEGMKDRVHQPYRQNLVPGLKESLELDKVDGLLGVCLSGAGPTILALATHNFEQIGKLIQQNFQQHNILSEVYVLNVDRKGTQVEYRH